MEYICYTICYDPWKKFSSVSSHQTLRNVCIVSFLQLVSFFFFFFCNATMKYFIVRCQVEHYV